MNKVLHVCHSISFGGISTFVKSLVKMNSIFQKKHYILVWRESYNGDYIIDISNKKNMRKAFRDLIKEYDTIFIHSLSPFMLYSLYKNKKKVFLFQHGVTFGKGIKKLIKIVYYNFTINFLNIKIICSSIYAEKKLCKNIFSIRKNVTIVQFGVSDKRLPNINETTNVFRVGYVGRLVSQKRVHRIFESFLKLNSDINIEIFIAGDGPEKEKLISLSKKLDTNKVKTKFLGNIKNMSTFYDGIDLFILPSIGESFGLVVLEANFRNIPVAIFKDSGACVEFIKNKQNGFILSDTKELSLLLKNMFSIRNRIKQKKLVKNYDLSSYHLNKTRITLDEISY